MTTFLRHDASPFSGPDGFVAAATSFVDEAREQSARPVVLTGARTLDRVRDALGRSPESFVAVDMDIDGRNPARLIPILQRLLDDGGQPLWCLCESIRPGLSADVVAEVDLSELLLHLPAFSRWNARLTCAYDVAALDDAVAAAIAHRHAAPPADPTETAGRALAEPLDPRPSDSAELGVDRTTLGALRGFVEQRARAAGVEDDRGFDLVYAVNEAVTNSMCHGEGRARVSVWTRPGALVCEVRDRGWVRDPLAGRVAPHPDGMTGRGFWLINQLCDLVQLRSSPTGTTVRMHILH